MPAHSYPSTLEARLEGKSDGPQAVIDIAQRAAEAKQLDPGHVYAFALGDRVHQVDLTGPEHTGRPPRKSGTTVVRDVDSFMAYFDKHSDASTEVYADLESRTITAVLDAHTKDGARWGGHRLQLRLRPTTAWSTWMAQDGQMLKQEAFAEFIEDNLVDLVEPDAATMLELAESFEATTSASFQSGTKLASGQRQLTYVEDVQAKAGSRGDIVIPAVLKLALRPFEGSDAFAVTARFRYRLANQVLTLGFKIERPDDVLANAFDDVRTAIDSDVEMAVLNGAPASR
ncbi:DUF2303 family protein [Streptomyces chryseus]